MSELTMEIILSKIQKKPLDQVTSLSLNNLKLNDISILSQFQQLESLSLNNNSIKDFSPLKNLKKLKELFLSNNDINNLSQIESLKNCTKLENLTLADNPIAKSQNYKQKIKEIFPKLKKLDGIDLSPETKKKIEVNTIDDILNDDLTENININQEKKKLETTNNSGTKTQSTINKVLLSFKKKKTVGTFRKRIRADLVSKDMNATLDNINNQIISSLNFNDEGNNTLNISSSLKNFNSKYNKKVVGKFQRGHNNMLSQSIRYDNEDEENGDVITRRINAIKSRMLKNNKSALVKNSITNVENTKVVDKGEGIDSKKEKNIVQSIKLLLGNLNADELNEINNELKKRLDNK